MPRLKRKLLLIEGKCCAKSLINFFNFSKYGINFRHAIGNRDLKKL